MPTFKFNPFTGNLDLTDTTTFSKLNPVTHSFNSAGFALSSFSSGNSTHLADLAPLVVVDNNGDVIDATGDC